jgi:sialate O-acetylesterase
MLYPFFNYNVRGAIWYQGESNMNKADEYAKLFPMMINDWRAQWNKDIPFLFVQLTTMANKKGKLPEVRKAQESVLSLNGVGMATIIDLGEDYNIHPINKLDVAKRLAIIADKQVYRDVVENNHPTIQKIVSKENMLLISFENPIVIKGNANEIKGFELSVNGEVFTKVSANRIDEKTIAVSHLVIKQPIVIRYLWEDAPKRVMIFDTYNMPLPPFKRQISE